MPVIVVHNAFGLDLPELDYYRYVDDLSKHCERKGELAEALRAAVLSVKELGEMKKGDIAVFMPEGFAAPRALTLISVDVLFASDQRTREVRLKLANALKDAAVACYAKKLGTSRKYQVEVAVRRFDAEADVYV